MNRLEGTIFLCGVGILALTGCTQPEPITDDSIYVGGKIGTIYVDTPAWAPSRDLEDCEVLLADGSIVRREGYCDDSTAAKKPKKPEPERCEPEKSKKPLDLSSKLGNPGNHKNVGRAGEKVSKGMAENGDHGKRGRSN